ncbi:putative nucleoredoxin 1 [Apium graveolens]|uniref:putative nucleoredoxin 1 n=1 Tax=Apium graveolens TaxID=4045 RepID=UPI003D7AA15F
MAMAMRKCLGRVIRGGVCNQSKCLSNCYYATATNWYKNNIYNSFTFSSENPKSVYNKVLEDVKGGFHFGRWLPLRKNYTTRVEPEDNLELIGVKKGEFVNLFDLLFTETRDYLIKCNDGRQVKAEELAGKVVIIYFDSVLDMDTDFIAYLIHAYNSLQRNCGFEVVFVNVDDAVEKLNGEISPAPSQGGPKKPFEDIFSCMPWAAIPLSDITSRERIKRRFGVPVKLYIGTPVVVDSTGMILQSHAYTIILNYGALGYPFSDERIDFLDSEDCAASRQPSLKALLASPERDYLISNKEDKVPIHTLEDMAVALYFYNDNRYCTNEQFTLILKGVYEELAKRNKKFEVVLIYLYDTPDTQIEVSFWKLFKTMPWLALPIGDSSYIKLERIFMFSWFHDYDRLDSRLVVLGPRMEFVETFRSDILSCFNFAAYPYSREKIATLLAEEAKELKLEMLWNPNSVFGGKYRSQVSLSQLDGKRVIFFFGKVQQLYKREVLFLESLKIRYIELKGTDDEFEVIQITDELCSKTEDVANLPWFVQHCGQDYSLSKWFNFYLKDGWYTSTLLIAFDQNGRVVRKTIHPTFENTNFPFYAGGLEKEASSQAVKYFGLDLLHNWFPGSIYSYRKN